MEEGRWVPKGKERVRKGAVPRRKPGVGSKTRQHAGRVGRLEEGRSDQSFGDFLPNPVPATPIDQCEA